MRASEMMHTLAVRCTRDTTVGAVARLMADCNVGSVVIIDEDGAVVGIVTDRDVTVRAVAEARSSDTPVEAIMTRIVASVEPGADIRDAPADRRATAASYMPPD